MDSAVSSSSPSAYIPSHHHIDHAGHDTYHTYHTKHRLQLFSSKAESHGKKASGCTGPLEFDLREVQQVPGIKSTRILQINALVIKSIQRHGHQQLSLKQSKFINKGMTPPPLVNQSTWKRELHTSHTMCDWGGEVHGLCWRPGMLARVVAAADGTAQPSTYNPSHFPCPSHQVPTDSRWIRIPISPRHGSN
jgi:hypothetical protein